jgi:hypothetical protein
MSAASAARAAPATGRRVQPVALVSAPASAQEPAESP